MKKIAAGQRRIFVSFRLTAAIACTLLASCDEDTAELNDNHPPYLPNGGFEQGAEGWEWPDKSAVAVVKSGAHSGVAALQIRADGPDATRIDGPRFPVVPGYAYHVSLWVWTVRPGPATLQFPFYTTDDEPIATEKSTPLPFPMQPGSWQKLEFTSMAPPGSHTGAILITADRGDSEFLIDDAAVVEMEKR